MPSNVFGFSAANPLECQLAQNGYSWLSTVAFSSCRVPNSAERVRGFLQWFERLDSAEQEVLISLVYKEKKVRDVVHSLASMARINARRFSNALVCLRNALSDAPTRPCSYW